MPFGRWGGAVGDDIITAAMLDRLVNSVERTYPSHRVCSASAAAERICSGVKSPVGVVGRARSHFWMESLLSPMTVDIGAVCT